MRDFEFTMDESVRTDNNYVLSYDRRIKITFEGSNSDFYYMTYVEEWNTDFWMSIPESYGFQALSEYLGYNRIRLKNHLKNHYGYKKIDGEFCFPKDQISRLINWFEGFKIINKLME